MCGIVRDCLVVMDEGCERLAETHSGLPVRPEAERVWHAIRDLTQRCRPLLDGAFVYADHVSAWSVNPSTYVTGPASPMSRHSDTSRGAELPVPSLGRQQAAQQQPTTISEGRQDETPKRLPAAAHREFGAVLGRYVEHGIRDRVEQEIRTTDWSAHVQEAALQLFWSLTSKPAASAPSSCGNQNPPHGTRGSIPAAEHQYL